MLLKFDAKSSTKYLGIKSVLEVDQIDMKISYAFSIDPSLQFSLFSPTSALRPVSTIFVSPSFSVLSVSTLTSACPFLRSTFALTSVCE